MNSLSLGVDHLKQEVSSVQQLGPQINLVNTSIKDMTKSVSSMGAEAAMLKPIIERKIDSSMALLLDQFQANQSFIVMLKDILGLH